MIGLLFTLAAFIGGLAVNSAFAQTCELIKPDGQPCMTTTLLEDVTEAACSTPVKRAEVKNSCSYGILAEWRSATTGKSLTYLPAGGSYIIRACAGLSDIVAACNR
jgi:hypothetical protein